MAISVSKFKNSCLDVIRRVEATGQAVSITRRGKVVARLAPSFQATQSVEAKPWQQLRALGGARSTRPQYRQSKVTPYVRGSPNAAIASPAMVYTCETQARSVRLLPRSATSSLPLGFVQAMRASSRPNAG